MEGELQWAVNYNFMLSGGFAYYDAKLKETYCGFTDLSGNPVTVCPAGTINPQTGDPIIITERRVLNFKASQILKHALNPRVNEAAEE